MCEASVTVKPDDRNPVRSVAITGRWANEKADEVASVEITFTMLNGDTYRRSDQYTIRPTLKTVATDWGPAIQWSGWWNHNPAVYLVGTVNVSADHPWYEEVQRKSGKLQFDASYPCRDLRNSN